MELFFKEFIPNLVVSVKKEEKVLDQVIPIKCFGLMNSSIKTMPMTNSIATPLYAYPEVVKIALFMPSEHHVQTFKNVNEFYNSSSGIAKKTLI
jgi:hypothetical protein